MSDITITVLGGVVNNVYSSKKGLDVMIIDYDNLKVGGTVDLYNSLGMDKEYEDIIKGLRDYGVKPEDLL